MVKCYCTIGYYVSMLVLRVIEILDLQHINLPQVLVQVQDQKLLHKYNRSSDETSPNLHAHHPSMRLPPFLTRISKLYISNKAFSYVDTLINAQYLDVMDPPHASKKPRLDRSADLLNIPNKSVFYIALV